MPRRSRASSARGSSASRGGPELAAAVAPLASDPSPVVRAELANYAGRPDLALAEAPARAVLLLGFARDVDPGVSAIALKGLARLAHRSALDGLAALVREGSAGQREGALRAMAVTPGSGPALLSLESWIEKSAPSLRGDWMLRLGLSGDERALPVFLRWASDPVDGAAAQLGFELLTQHQLFRREDAAYTKALEAWSAVEALDAAWRRVRFELWVRVDLAAAREAAARVDRLASTAGESERLWRTRARTVAAICDMADGKGKEAEAAIGEAQRFVEAGAVATPDGEERDAWLMNEARLDVLSAFNAALNPFPGAPAIGERLRAGYQCYDRWVVRNATRAMQRIRALNPDSIVRYVQAGGAFPYGVSANWNFDFAFESDLGAISVIGVVLPKRGRGADGLAAGRRLLEELASINPREFVTAASQNTWQTFPDPFEELDLGVVPGIEVVDVPESEITDDFGNKHRLPAMRIRGIPMRVSVRTSLSGIPRQLGLIARGTLGDLVSAAKLFDPLIERASLGTQMGDLATFVDASLDRAGVAMDARDGDLADRIVERALARLDDVKANYEKEFDEELVRRSGAAGAEALTDRARAWLDLARRKRAEALITRAVNENVVRRRPQVASGYAKKGVELDPNEFNRVLLACYYAREGNAVQARAILRDAVDSPATFYNLACTHALLGDSDTALHYLERDFQEKSDPGGLERARAWARKDPDLRSLEDDPRFRALVGPAEPRPAGR